MPPKKKAKKKPSDPSLPEHPLEYVELMRARMRERVGSYNTKALNNDIEQNVREIRAILVINEEIFDRCVGSMKYFHQSSFVASFRRCSFDAVQVRTVKHSTQFITEPERSTRDFDLKHLINLPESLKDTFVVKHKKEPNDKFIDYESLFQMSLALNEDTLGVFLANLKDHLESVQVCLGQIDEWIMEPMRNIKYIKKIFGTKLHPPQYDETIVGKCQCPDGTHSSDDLCEHCGNTFGSHKNWKRQCYSIISKSKDDSSSSDSDSDSSDSDSNRSSGVVIQKGTFQCRKVHVLKECKESGVYRRTFDISKDAERARLEKFLDFITS